MVFFSLTISVGLFEPARKYEDIAPTMDTYTFNGNTLAEIAEKVKRVFGMDRKWTETSAITLTYNAVVPHNGKVIPSLAIWDNTRDANTLPNLIYGVWHVHRDHHNIH